MATLALAQGDVANARLFAEDAHGRSRKLGVGHYEAKAERVLRMLSSRRPAADATGVPS